MFYRISNSCEVGIAGPAGVGLNPTCLESAKSSKHTEIRKEGGAAHGEVVCRNIPHAFSKQEIAQWVESFGFPVESVDIIFDRHTGNPRGFGFVLLKDDGRLTEAIEQLNGELMGGRPITVNQATPPIGGGTRFREIRR